MLEDPGHGQRPRVETEKQPVLTWRPLEWSRREPKRGRGPARIPRERAQSDERPLAGVVHAASCGALWCWCEQFADGEGCQCEGGAALSRAASVRRRGAGAQGSPPPALARLGTPMLQLARGPAGDGRAALSLLATLVRRSGSSNPAQWTAGPSMAWCVALLVPVHNSPTATAGAHYCCCYRYRYRHRQLSLRLWLDCTPSALRSLPAWDALDCCAADCTLLAAPPRQLDVLGKIQRPNSRDIIELHA